MDQEIVKLKEATVKLPPDLSTFQKRGGIRYKVLTAILSLILTAVIVITTVTVLSARVISQRAQRISSQSLRSQAETYLAQITASTAREYDLILDRANRDAQALENTTLTIYKNIGEKESIDPGTFWSFDKHMFQVDEGQYMNSKEDITTVLVPDFQEITAAVRRDVELGAFLDLIFAGIFDNNPNIEAIYFATPNEVTRYYPNIGLGELVPPDFQVTGRPWYVEALVNNQGADKAHAIWTPPYTDATGLGLVTTVAIPVYNSSKELLGVIGMDITLDEVSSNIQATRILKTGYSFLIDKDGRSIILPPQGYIEMLGRTQKPDEFGTDLLLETKDFSPVIEEMTSGETGFTSIFVEDQEMFVAYAPLPSTGWSLGSVVKADEVLESVALLEKDLQNTNLSLLLTIVLPGVLGISVLLVILSLLWTNRLVNPIRDLAEAARKIGAGQWDTSIPVRGKDEIGLLGYTLNKMAKQLNVLFTDLENRVATRTRQLEKRSLQLQTAAEVARDITTSEHLDELLESAVNLIHERFGFYNVTIFLTDDSGEYAYLTAASGQAEAELREKKLRLKIGQEGIVGKVISQAEPKVVFDVSEEPSYLEYPSLPDTKSEVALPLRVGPKVIGALDVQSTSLNAFDRDEVTVLQTLADQLAIAIENIRLVEKLQATLAQIQYFYQGQIKDNWSQLATQGKYAYEFDQLRVRPIVQNKQYVSDDKKSRLMIPIKLRQQVIGYIGLESDDSQHEWTSDEIAIAEATADQAALTLENARLLEETQHQAKREQMMGQIAARVRETLDLEMVLQTTVREISQAMNLKEAEIRLGTMEKSGNGKE